jgi:hypothetical protein
MDVASYPVGSFVTTENHGVLEFLLDFGKS